ncbi:LmeA family phospholipid-binding protein [Rubrivirga sp.]|uniref:LmeA family phospholipid-binding protein n=1 Tax=Rubrivirga sp. TaxID=1885344 RepID=UPI003C7335E7
MAIRLFTLALLVSGCSVSGRVASEIEAALPEAIGPADEYQVSVEGVSVTSSTADRIEVVGLRVARENAPVIDRFEAVLEDVVFDRGEKEITGVGSASATAFVLTADLDTYLEGLDGISDATLTLSAPDQMLLTMRGELADYEIPVNIEIRGRFAAEAGVVRLNVISARAGRINISGFKDRIEREINPVLDLTDDDIALTVTDVRVEDGVLVLEAAGDLSGLQISRGVKSDMPRSDLSH